MLCSFVNLHQAKCMFCQHFNNDEALIKEHHYGDLLHPPHSPLPLKAGQRSTQTLITRQSKQPETVERGLSSWGRHHKPIGRRPFVWCSLGEWAGPGGPSASEGPLYCTVHCCIRPVAGPSGEWRPGSCPVGPYQTAGCRRRSFWCETCASPLH